MKKWKTIEIDNTKIYLEILECETKTFKVVTCYIDDNTDYGMLNPLFSLIYYNDKRYIELINYDDDIEVLNQLHDTLVEKYIYDVK